jgi:predicted TIM-barrel fold metal-dependent hydrolase
MRNSFVYIISAVMIFAGCKSNYYSMDDYQSVLKIDSHTHIFTDKGFFEDQAVKDNFILLAINVDHADSAAVISQHEIALNSMKKYPANVYYAATFYFDTTGFGTESWSNKVISHLEKDIAGGAVSVKIWKNIGMTERTRDGRFIMVDDPALDPVINFIISKNLPVTGHLGEPRDCWLPFDKMTVSGDSSYYAKHPQYHMFLHPEYPSYEDQINARDRLLEKHPELIFVGCHLGSLEWNVDELAKRLDKFPNMTVDMAARICHLEYQSLADRNKVREFCIKYQDRLLYGTDLSDEDALGSNEVLAKQIHETWIEDWKFFTTDEKMTSPSFRGEFAGLQLPKEVVRKIYSENAIKWYKLAVK